MVVVNKDHRDLSYELVEKAREEAGTDFKSVPASVTGCGSFPPGASCRYGRDMSEGEVFQGDIIRKCEETQGASTLDILTELY